GAYRASSPSLAFVPVASVEDRDTWRFFAGVDSASGMPRWSAAETDAQPLFDHPCVGELSVTWNAYLGRWLMLYNCLDPFGIIMRSAEQPWGPWSDAAVLFDRGYCHFIHFAFQPPCDHISDPGREDTPGGPYGPYVIQRFNTGAAGVATIYFTM